jgi:malonate transporter
MMVPVMLAIEASDLLANAGRLGILAVPALLGVLVVRLRQVPDVPAAIGALNTYTLHLGFPALIAVGVLEVDPSVASTWGFWAVIPVVDLVLIAISWAAGRRLAGRQGGSLALVLLFGNTAYLGLPFAVSVLGEPARGPASLLVAVQVTLAVLVGPVLLQRWSGDGPGSVGWARLLRQPLLLAPFVAVMVRQLPDGVVGGVHDVLGPLAASTAPVAMFLLGLYLVENWELVRTAEHGVWTHVVLRMLVAPAVNAAVAVWLFEVGTISSTTMAVIVVLGGMPAAISTFSIAHHEGVAADRVASVVVRSSVAALVTMPVLATVAEQLSRR